MITDATIIGTREGSYLACLDEERLEIDCDNECPSCSHPCRVLLKKDQLLEKGRSVQVEIHNPLIHEPRKLVPFLMTVFILVTIVLVLFRKIFLPYYRGFFLNLLGGGFATAALYLILKLIDEKKGTSDTLRKGRIIRVYPRETG